VKAKQTHLLQKDSIPNAKAVGQAKYIVRKKIAKTNMDKNGNLFQNNR